MGPSVIEVTIGVEASGILPPCFGLRAIVIGVERPAVPQTASIHGGRNCKVGLVCPSRK